jgi:basic membrane protein A
VNTLLSEISAGNFANYGGQVATLGLVGTDPAANYVQIAPTTQFADGFTEADYADLVAKMFAGEVTVSNAIDAMPATTITVNDAGSVK